MPIFVRYLLFQLPEWLAASVVGYVLVRLDTLTPGLALLVLALFVAKDLLLYPHTRIALEPATLHGREALLGARAIALQSLEPEGYVRVGHESWRARLVQGHREAPAGAHLAVRDVQDLTLLVEPVGEAAPRQSLR